MSEEFDWDDLVEWLSDEHLLELAKGSKFKAAFIEGANAIEIVPTKTGIPRRINERQWDIFVDKFREVKKSGYDPYRPGHYAQISHNASYLVAILLAYESD